MKKLRANHDHHLRRFSVTPGYAEEQRGTLLQNIAIVFSILEVLFVILRYVSQALTPKKRGWDDYLMVPALLMCLGLNACSIGKLEPIALRVELHRLIQLTSRRSSGRRRISRGHRLFKGRPGAFHCLWESCHRGHYDILAGVCVAETGHLGCVPACLYSKTIPDGLLCLRRGSRHVGHFRYREYFGGLHTH